MGQMKNGGSLKTQLNQIKSDQAELNETLKSILGELILLNKSLPVVKDIVEESENLNSRRKDLEIKSLIAQRQLTRSQRSGNGNNK